MSFTPEQRYKGGLGALEFARHFEERTGKNWYAHITKGRPRRGRFIERREMAARPAPASSIHAAEPRAMTPTRFVVREEKAADACIAGHQ